MSITKLCQIPEGYKDAPFDSLFIDGHQMSKHLGRSRQVSSFQYLVGMYIVALYDLSLYIAKLLNDFIKYLRQK